MKYIIQIILVILLFACSENTESVNTEYEVATVETEADISNIHIQSSTFTEIDSSGVLLFPLVFENGNNSTSMSYKKSQRNYGYWNFIFYNGHTGNSYLLTEDKIWITNYSFVNELDNAGEAKETLDFIFYTANNHDYNQDGKLDDRDPQGLFVSDKSGQNFRQLSPENYDLKSWEYVHSLDKIILNAAHDANGDLVFDEKDEEHTFAISLEPNVQPQEIFNSNFQKKIKTLFARDWVSKED